MKKMVVIGTDSLLWCAKQMLDRCEITPKQYNDMCIRARSIPEEHRKDVLCIGE